MKKTITAILILGTTALLTGCVQQQQQQQEIPQAYVSPLEFKSYNCKQIEKEMAYVSAQYNQATASNPVGDVLGAAVMAYGMSRGYAMSSGGGEDPAVAQLRAKY